MNPRISVWNIKMIISRENLVELLDMDLELEITGAIQCINHSVMLTGVACGDIARVLRIYAHKKIDHAITLADQITYFGGFPSIRVGKVHISTDNEEMLLFDFEDREDAIRRYRIRIEQAEQLKEMELSRRLRMILRVEQQYAMHLKKQVFAGTRANEGTNLSSMNACDFSQQWAENAAKVPIRNKKKNCNES